MKKRIRCLIVTTATLYKLLRAPHEVSGVLLKNRGRIHIIIYSRSQEAHRVTVAPVFFPGAMVFHTHLGPSRPSTIDIQTSKMHAQAKIAIFGTDGCTILTNGKVVGKVGPNRIWGVYTDIVIEERVSLPNQQQRKEEK